MRSHRTRCAFAVAVVAAVITAGLHPVVAGAAPADDVEHPAPVTRNGVRVVETTVALASSPTEATVVELDDGPELLGIEAPGAEAIAIRSRVDGSWGPWTDVHRDAAEGPDGQEAREGVDGADAMGPVWLGHDAEAVELAVVEGAATTATLHELDTSDVPRATPAGSAELLVPGGADGEQPAIRARTSWASGGWACSGPPDEAATIEAAVIHHTATANTYGPADVPAILRGIYQFHVGTQGWCDIAYNFVVDRFGTIWEGRSGGPVRPVIGAHSKGFNTGTVGVSMLGDTVAAGVPSATGRSVERLVAWKLSLHGVDPNSTTVLTNRADIPPMKFPFGAQVRVPRVVTHRDLGVTACPGDNGAALVPGVRRVATAVPHVSGLYELFFGSSPSTTTFARWWAEYERADIPAVAFAMARSDAYAGMRVDDLYRRVLGRPADPTGRAYWLGRIRDGMRLEDVGVYFYGSEERYRAAGSAEAYVTDLYRELLHRDPDPAGLRYWSDALRRSIAGPADVTYGFYASIESRRDRVSRLYLEVLGRRPDPSGAAYWTDRLRTVDDIVLAAELATSPEFGLRALR